MLLIVLQIYMLIKTLLFNTILPHNGQIFTLDSAGDENVLFSAGDTWLLPDWMGRYLGVMSGPGKRKN